MPKEESSPCSILIVEDMSDAREVLKFLMQTSGYEVTVARDGTEALNILFRERFDALVIDMNMPGLNGVELVSAVRHEPEFTGLPIILMSGAFEKKSFPTDIQADAFIGKPFEFSELQALLARFACHPGSTAYSGADDLQRHFRVGE